MTQKTPDLLCRDIREAEERASYGFAVHRNIAWAQHLRQELGRVLIRQEMERWRAEQEGKAE